MSHLHLVASESAPVPGPVPSWAELRSWSLPDEYRLQVTRVDNCGKGFNHTFGGEFGGGRTMCGSLHCSACANWKIGHRSNSRAWHKQYDAMSPAVFDSETGLVFLQPFQDNERTNDKVTKRARRRGAWMIRARTTGYVSLCFSSSSLATVDDLWPARCLSVEDARRYFLDVIVQPGTLAHKPTTNTAAAVWDLASEEREPSPQKKVGWTTVGIASEVQERATAALERSRPVSMPRELWNTPERAKHHLGRVTAEVLAEEAERAGLAADVSPKSVAVHQGMNG